MTFIVRTRIGDIDVNPKNHPLGRRDLLKRAQRLVQRALQEGEAATVFERANGREAQVDAVTGQYVRTGSPANAVAAGLQRRGGAGAGTHHTRVHDVMTGRARRGRHGGRAGVLERENPTDYLTIEDEDIAPAGSASGAAGRGSAPGGRPMPGSEAWKALSKEEREALKTEMSLELLATLQNVPLSELKDVLARGGASYPATEHPVNPFDLSIYSDIEDVRAAARALHIPSGAAHVIKDADVQGIIDVSSGGGGPIPGTNVYGFGTPSRRPMVQFLEELAHGQNAAQTILAFKLQLSGLATWLKENNIRKVRIVAPAVGLARSRAQTEVLSGPIAGDMVYFLATAGAAGGVTAGSTAIVAPISGRVVEATAQEVVLEDVQEYSAHFDRTVNDVNDLRSDLSDALDAVQGMKGRTDADLRRSMREIEQSLSPYAIDIKRTDPEVQAAYNRYLREYEAYDLSQAAQAAKTHGGAVTRSPEKRKQFERDSLTKTIQQFADRFELLVFPNTEEYTSALAEYEALRQKRFRLRAGVGVPQSERHAARVASLKERLSSLVPALRSEAFNGYPSLSRSASAVEVARAVRAIYAAPSAQVTVNITEGRAPFDSVLVPRQGVSAVDLAQAVGREAELRRDIGNLETRLRSLQNRDPQAVEAILDSAKSASVGDPSAATFGQVFGAQLEGVALHEQTEAQKAAAAIENTARTDAALAAELIRINDNINDLGGELRKTQRRINELGRERLKFTGRISVRVAVPLRSRSGPFLPLLPGITVGSVVAKGQPLTQAATIAQAPAATSLVPSRQRPAGLTDSRKRAVAMDPRMSEQEAAAVVNLTQPDASKPVRKYLALPSTNLHEGQVGTFNVARTESEGTGKDKKIVKIEEVPVFAEVVREQPISFGEVLNLVGGFGHFLVEFGYMPAANLSTFNPSLVEAKALNAQATDALIKKVIGERNRPVVEWVQGKRNLNIIRLMPEAPAGVATGEISSADIRLSGQIPPAYPAAGKPVQAADIAQVTMYTIWQDHPTESAQILTEKVNLMGRGEGLGHALAKAANRRQQIIKHTASMADRVGRMTKKEREALITPEDKEVAKQRAARFGNSPRDLDYIATRLMRAKLEEAVAAYPDVRRTVALEQGARTSAVEKLAQTLKVAEPQKYRNFTTQEIISGFRPDRMEILDAVEKMKEKIATPNVTTDPMADVLLIAELRADASGRSQASFELIVDWEHLTLKKGQRGNGLARLIAAFEAAPQLGFVPSEYPKSKGELFALKLLGQARGMSSTSALNAARLGLDFSERGDFGVSKVSLSPGARAAIDLEGGITVESGKRGAAAVRSFGQIGSVQSRSRRDILMSRLPREIAAKAVAPRGAKSSAYALMKEKYEAAKQRAVSEGRSGDIPRTQAEMAAEAARERALDAAMFETGSGASGPEALAEDFAFSFDIMPDAPVAAGSPATAETTAYPDDDMMFVENPYRRARLMRQAARTSRVRRNPSSAELAAAVNTLPNDIRVLLDRIKGALAEYAENPSAEEVGALPPLTPEQKQAIQAISAIAAVSSWAARALGPDATDPAAIQAVLPKVLNTAFASEVIKANFDTAEGRAAAPVLDLPRGPVALSRTAQFAIREAFLAGLFYSASEDGRLSDRTPSEIAALVTMGPFAAAWMATHASRLTQADLVAFQPEDGADRRRVLRQVEDAAEALQTLPKDKLGPAVRVLAPEEGGAVKVVQAGFILSEASKLLLKGFTEAERLSASVTDLHRMANTAYSRLMDEIIGKARVNKEAAAAFMTQYENSVAALQRKIADTGADTKADVRSLIEAKLMHFLAARTPEGEERPSKERRMATLKGTLARYLDFYGRPLLPIPAQSFAAMGLRAPLYGENVTLESRVTLPQARRIVERTSGQAGRQSISTSTLDCRAGIGRGINEFSRPYTGYRPSNWPSKRLLNVIWLSPNGQVARIYRLGAAVCMFRRHPNETLVEFLSEVAENWNLWLTDPQHQRMGREHALEVFLGQSGDATGHMYRINTEKDKAALSRGSFVKRANAAGADFGPNEIISKTPRNSAALNSLIEKGKIVVWGAGEEVTQDAQNFLDAMEAAGLLSNADVDSAVRNVIGRAAAIGGAQAAGAQMTQDAQADLVVLFPPTHYYKGTERVPTGGTGTIPTGRAGSGGFDSTVAAFLLAPSTPYKALRVYDRSYIKNLRTVALKNALNLYTPTQSAQAAVELKHTPVGFLVNEIEAVATDPNMRMVIVEGGATGELKKLEDAIAARSDNHIAFSKAASRLGETDEKSLLKTALQTSAPIMVVEVQDVPMKGGSGDRKVDGLSMLAEVYEILRKEGRITTTPVVYTYPSVRGAYDVADAVNRMRVALSKEMNVEPDQIPLHAVAYENLAVEGAPALTRRAANPRHRSMRQVAAQWMRTYPFPG